MSFQGLDKILEIVTQQPQWEGYRQYCQLVKCWQLAVSASVVDQTRPLYISRQVLWVATASAVLAQELSLQRYTLLKKLNSLLDEPIEDIRFSSAQWHSHSLDTDNLTPMAETLSAHPSYCNEHSELLEKNTQDSLGRWLDKIRQKAHSWPLCPQCQCPTPKGELQRWNCCAFCFARSDPSQP